MDAERCAVHPLRPASDRCPVCGRGRCGADARTAPGGGCLACGGRGPSAPTAVPLLERLVRAALAATAVTLPGGLVAAQYVGAGLFAYLTPAVVGVLCGAAAQAAAGGPRRGRAGAAVRALACGYAVLAVALGFVLEASVGPLDATTALPYAAAAAGAFLWTLPPRGAPRTPRRPPPEGRPSRSG